jgi:putative endonuclease
MSQAYIYILSNFSRTLYVGVTSDLSRRVNQHKHKLITGFTSKYNISELVYYETTDDMYVAIQREKQLKGWKRERKIALVESMNPDWLDLSDGWYD